MSALPMSSTFAASPEVRRRRRLPRLADLGLSRRPKRIWFFALALILLVAATAGQRIAGERTDELARAEERTRFAAIMLKAHLERIFDFADANLKSLDDTPATASLTIDRGRQDLSARLAALTAPGQLFVNMLITDAEGRVIAAGRSDTEPPPDLSLRTYFLRHREDRSPALMISEPMRTRPNGLTVPVSRRIETRQGNFDGVVVAGLRSEQLIDLYRSLEPLSVSAHLLDGTLLAQPPESMPVGQRLATALAQRLALSPAETFETNADGRSRIVTYVRLDRWPVLVAVEFDHNTALAGWRASRNGILILALIFAATVIGTFLIIERQIAALAAARVAAEAADRAKSHFLAHMSHELRTPLNAVIGFAEIMGQEVFGPLGSQRYHQYVRDIHLSGEHLLTTITNILDLAKVSSGHWKVDRRLVSPAKIATDVRRLLGPEARSRRVALSVDLDQSLPTLLSDRRMLGQILLNIVGSALRFTPEGGSVSLTAKVLDAALVFHVIDTGPGMSREEIQVALQPLGGAGSVLTTKSRDAGLALPLARAFAELLGGRFRIESAPGRGTVVTVVLPLGNISLSAMESWRARRDSNSQPSDP
jgi:two-component system cell cycle sensor histidine kinase PleC